MIVEVNVEVNNKSDTLKKITRLAQAYKKIKNEEVYLQALLSREEAFTTGCGSGIAIPHGKSSTVLEHGIIVLKLKKHVDWQAIDDSLVDLVIALIIPEEHFDEECLLKQSKLARALINEIFVSKLRALDKPECIKKMMQEVMK
ncbi:MAG: PTS sugar transporter subunit IIA [Cellulosilyticaceae bacterium]